MLAHLPSELQLACLLCRPALSDRARESAEKIVHAGVNWNRFLDFVLLQTIFPLVAQHACETLSYVIPGSVLTELRVCAMVNGGRSEAMADELTAILTLLEKAGIRAVALKGPVLIQRIWGDCRLGVSRDLDILVRPEDAQRAAAILADRGYRPNEEYLHGFPLWKHGSHSVPLVRSNALPFPILVDLETTFEHEWFRGSIPADSFWQQLQKSDFRGTTVRVLRDDWNLVLVALHALRHLFMAFHWVAEVHGLVGQSREAWPDALRLADRLGVREEVLLARNVCDLILGEDSVQPDGMEPLVRRLAECPFSPPTSRVAQHRLQIALHRRACGKIAYLMSGFFRPGPGDSDFLTLPAPLSYAYYVLRPIRLATKYLVGLPTSTVWKFVSRSSRQSDDFGSSGGRQESDRKELRRAGL